MVLKQKFEPLERANQAVLSVQHLDDHLEVTVRNFRRKVQNHRIRILDQVDLEDQVRASVGIRDNI